MKKFAVLLLFVVSVSSVLFASVTEGTEDLLIAHTQNFDVIYREESFATAKVVFENVERIYREVSGILGYDMKDFRRVPIVITDQRYVFNAYFSKASNAHIVIINTFSQIGELTTFEDSILGVLRHEMSHTIQDFIRGPFWRALPIFSPQTIYSPPYVSEGLAVMAESYYGSGRLNDKTFVQQLIQSKLEGKFPTDLQASGARDVFPYGIEYSFGGAFIDWLRRTHSLEDVQKFVEWNGRLLFRTTYTNYIDSFSEDLGTLWAEFRDSVQVPEVSEPSLVDDKKGIINSMQSRNGRILGYDSSTADFFEMVGNERKHLFYHATYYPEIGIMSDGRILAPMVDYLDRYLHVFKDGRIVHTFNNERAGFAANRDGKEVIVTYSENNRVAYLSVWNAENYEPIGRCCLGSEVYVGSFCTLDNGLGAMLINKNSHSSIVLFDPSTFITYKLENKDDLRFQSLTANGNKLCFSYSNTMTCYGEIDIEIEKPDSQNDALTIKSVMRLSDKLYNAGIIYPVRVGDEVTYIASFYDFMAVAKVPVSDLNLSEPEPVDCSLYTAMFDVYDPSDPSVSTRLNESSTYNPVGYFATARVVPLAISYSDMFSSNIGLGLSYWTRDPSETLEFRATSGWNPFTGQGFTGLNLANYTRDIPFAIRANFVYPKFSFDVSFSAAWKLVLSHPGEMIKITETAGLKYEECKTYFNNKLYFIYSNLRSTGFTPNDYTGFETGVGALYYEYKTDDITGLAGELLARYHLPKFFIPHVSVTGGTEFGLTHNFNVYGLITITPVSVEIQDGFLEFYFNRFVLDLSYKCALLPRDLSLRHTIGAKAYFTMAARIGSLTSNGFDLGVEFIYVIGDPDSFKISPVATIKL